MNLFEIVKDGMMRVNWHRWAYIYFKIVTQSNLFPNQKILTILTIITEIKVKHYIVIILS